jgi:sulfide:quinone oxidoreductase
MTLVRPALIPLRIVPGAAAAIGGEHRVLSVFSRSGYARGVDRFRVVICGGGIAAVEGLLRLRRRLGEAVHVTVLAPNEELHYRPVAVQEPFSRPSARRYPLRDVMRRTDAEWVQEELEWVDPDGQVAHTAEGGVIAYDALLVAVGARTEIPYEHVTVFDDAHADETYRGLVQDVEEGYTRSVALLLPEGPAWPLPIYELALMTAERAGGMGMEGLGVDVVTAEPQPLAAFGDRASDAVSELLHSARVRVHLASRAEVSASRKLTVQPEGRQLEPERIVSMPKIVGHRIRALPADADGFIPIDELCRVSGLEPRVFAAGDAANVELKFGGLSAQMADTAADGIAGLAGADIVVAPLRPRLRGVLYTGAEPLYLTAEIEDGRVESKVSRDRPWPADEKVVAEELGPFLRSLD